MDVKAKRAFYGDEKGVKTNQVITVSEPRGRELIRRGLVEQVGAQKAAAAPRNKMAAKPADKSA